MNENTPFSFSLEIQSLPDNMASGGDNYFKDPNVIEHKMSETVLKFDPFPVPGYDETRSALGKVATAESYDGLMKSKGTDNYTLSLKALLDGFDAFIREYNKNSDIKDMHTGNWSNFDLKDPNDLTILLIWQIRHVLIHRGGCIDQKCKDDYDKVFREGQALGTSTVMDLPSSLPIGKYFNVNHDQYFSLKTAIFNIIKKKLPHQDMVNLALKSAATNTRIVLNLHDGQTGFKVKMGDLEKNGVPLDYKDGKFILPLFILDKQGKRLIMKTNGVAIPIQLHK